MAVKLDMPCSPASATLTSGRCLRHPDTLAGSAYEENLHISLRCSPPPDPETEQSTQSAVCVCTLCFKEIRLSRRHEVKSTQQRLLAHSPRCPSEN